MPKIDWFAMDWTVTSWTDEAWREAHRWENLPEAERAELTAEAWRQWILASCEEQNGGHRWWLDYDEEDGLWLHCQHCPAGVDDLYPDGQCLMDGSLPLADGRVLVIDCGAVPLDCPVQEWHGPVKAEAWSETHHSLEWGTEYSGGVAVEAA
jgi:hypothetical protein